MVGTAAVEAWRVKRARRKVDVTGYILTVWLRLCWNMWCAVMTRDLFEDCFKDGSVVFGF